MTTQDPGGSAHNAAPEPHYPIDPHVATTVDRMIAFPATVEPGLSKTELDSVARYEEFGYGDWHFGAGLPMTVRVDLMPDGYAVPPESSSVRVARFFTFSDVHITDKEAPNQLIYFQQHQPAAAEVTSIYSPVMMYTTHVLDAAIQTVNALHGEDPFTFGLCLGDTCNSTSFNELRWYIDVFDGKAITPSSGAHLGAGTVDFQAPYQSAGLDPGIPWYQVIGNHDHFMIGSFPIDAQPELGLRESYVAGTVWSVGDPLAPDLSSFPALFDTNAFGVEPRYHPGVIDGSDPLGGIVKAGPSSDAQFAAGPPTVTADPDRRSLTRSEWVSEFFDTTTEPVGHGFGLVDGGSDPGSGDGFACYSFLTGTHPQLKVIVLDNTQSEHDGSRDIHGHGYLDARRWEWLRSELAEGQAADQLMIVAAHVPIGVAGIGSELEWWAGDANTKPGFENAVSLADLVGTLHDTPNLLAWLAGHRHVNVAKAFPSPDPSRPEAGFWQVETSSLRDFPQQLRTFDIRVNGDYSVSIRTVNVDPAVADGTPAAASRSFAVATQQIVQNDMRPSSPNFATAGGLGGPPVPSMDPTRPQSDDRSAVDDSIRFVDLVDASDPVAYHASYNGELLVPLSAAMVRVLQSGQSAD